MIKDLQTNVDKIIELELRLDDAKESYKNLESFLTEGQRSLKRKMDTMQRNLEQLTIMYHQLITQKSQIQVEKQLNEKKLLRANERLKTAELELEKYKEYFKETERKIAGFGETALVKEKKRHVTGNIMKTIQGGNKLSRFKTHFRGSS